MAKHVLVVGAHPDDEVLGCGGAIARHVAEGDEVMLLVMADGVTSRTGAGDAEISARVKETRLAADALGILHVGMFGYPDQRMSPVDLLEYAKRISKQVESFQPSIVYTHWPHDLNQDHRITSQSVMTACRPIKGSSVRKILYFEVPSSTEWTQGPAFTPNYFVNIEGFLPKKLLAFAQYNDGWPSHHPRSPMGIEALAHWRGVSVGLRAAEAFVLARWVG